jgi:GTP-binding protein Era
LSGLPNAGKSSLLNCLINKKISIVSSKVQTTNDEISGILNKKNTQLIFTDTPGLVEKKKFNKKKLSRVLLNQEFKIDLNLFIYDLQRNINKRSLSLMIDVSKRFKNNYLILNKIDLVNKNRFLDISKELNSIIKFEETFMISAKKKKGIDTLIEKLIFNAPEREWIYENNIDTDKTLNFRLSEVTREKIFHLLNKEIPYSVKILTKIKKNEKITNVFQDIIVKKDSQKSILIGKNGEKIKMIGSRARMDIQKILKQKVFLSLIVKKKIKK